MTIARLLVLVCLTLVTALASAQPTPLNSSVLLFDLRTLQRAPRQVERAAELGNRRVLFVVTVQCRLSPELRVLEHGFMVERRNDWASPDNFIPLDEERLTRFTDRLAKAFGRAVELGMDVAVLPHYDPAGEVLEWRNLYRFDPFEERRGYSYATAVIDPTIEALRRVAKPTTRIQFSLSGEMGRSLFEHPAAYRRLAKRVRDWLGDWPLEVGVSLNHSGVTGEYEPTADERREVQALINDCDFLGFSNYSPFKLPPSPEQFGDSCQKLLDELAALSITLPDGTPMQFTEIGLGGHRADPASAAAKPWEGGATARRSPWELEPMTQLRRDYHAALLDFLRTQPGPRRVSAAYFWSQGPWDPQGIDQPRFADEAIIEAIREHNEAVDAAAIEGE